jgi:hypothetical protein
MLTLTASVVLINSGTSLQAQQASGEATPLLGRASATEYYPAAISFDRKWTAKGYNILDAQGKTVFTWEDSGFVVRDYMTISWSPDSAHVVFVDQGPRAPEIYCAELVNGKWQNVRIHLYEFKDGSEISKVDDLKNPDLSIKHREHDELLNWVSPTMLQVKKSFIAADPRSPEPKTNQYVTTLQFKNGEAFFAR